MTDLTTTQAAEALRVAPVTVRLWCRQGRFPNAYSVDTPRGVVWYIPKGDLNGVEPMKPGPKPATKAGRQPSQAKAPAKSKKKGGKK